MRQSPNTKKSRATKSGKHCDYEYRDGSYVLVYSEEVWDESISTEEYVHFIVHVEIKELIDGELIVTFYKEMSTKEYNEWINEKYRLSELHT